MTVKDELFLILEKSFQEIGMEETTKIYNYCLFSYVDRIKKENKSLGLGLQEAINIMEHEQIEMRWFQTFANIIYRAFPEGYGYSNLSKKFINRFVKKFKDEYGMFREKQSNEMKKYFDKLFDYFY